MEKAAQQAPTHGLLQLPDACLLAVLHCCVDDPASLFSVARTHSKLHQAAVQALGSSMAPCSISKQQTLDSVGLYLHRHGAYISSISLLGPLTPSMWDPSLISYTPSEEHTYLSLPGLPPTLQQLSSMVLSDLELQLQPGAGGSQGVLQPGMPLTSLQVSRCSLSDGADGLAAALASLPGLEHLCLVGNWCDLPLAHGLPAPGLLPGLQHLALSGDAGGKRRLVPVAVRASVLRGLQQLTQLELTACIEEEAAGPNGATNRALQHLQALTRLVELRLRVKPMGWRDLVLGGSVLSGMRQLTCLSVQSSGKLCFEPAILAGHTQLRHLEAAGCRLLPDGGAGVAALLSYLQPLQQLTYLRLDNSIPYLADQTPPAAAFAALTASSQLRGLDLRECRLPAAAWEHMFPAGWQLPHLTALDISADCSFINPVEAPSGARLLSCCPALRDLGLVNLACSPELLASLQRLSGLQALHLGDDSRAGIQMCEALCRLTGLRELSWHCSDVWRLRPDHLVRLATQLTYFYAPGPCSSNDSIDDLEFHQVPDGEPVWRQLLQWQVNHGGPEVAQQAAAALAAAE